MIKIRFLDKDIGNCRYNHKCGADPVSAAILGGTSLISSGVGLLESDSAMTTNLQENEKNRRFNREESKKVRDWQTAEREASQGYQTAEWDRRNQIEFQTWLKQNDYNNPVNQVKRLQAAGFNPAAMSGSSAEGLIDSSTLQPSVTPVSAPSSSPASVSTPNPVQAVQGSQAMSSLLSSVGSLISDTARAGKDNAEARQLNATLTSVVNEYAEKIKSLQLENDLKEIEKYRQSSTFPASIGKVFAELDKLQADIIIARRTGDLVDAQTYTEKMRKVLMDSEFDLKEQEVQKGLIYLDKYGKILDAQINEMRGSAAAGFGSAALSAEQAKTEIQLRDVREKVLDAQNDLLRAQKHGQNIENWIKSESGQAVIESTIQASTQAGLITKKEAVELSQALYQYDIRKINSFFDWLGKGVGAYRDVGIGISAFRGFPSSSKSSFDPDAGKAFFMDENSGLLFRAPWSK